MIHQPLRNQHISRNEHTFGRHADVHLTTHTHTHTLSLSPSLSLSLNHSITHTHTHTNTFTRIHTHSHTHTHTHTHTPPPPPPVHLHTVHTDDDKEALSSYAAINDLDFSLFDGDGDFPHDLPSRLPHARLDVDGRHAHARGSGEITEMDISEVESDLQDADGVELLDGGVVTPTSPFFHTNMFAAPVGGAVVSSTSPFFHSGMFAMPVGGGCASSALHGSGPNPLSIVNMFPQSGVSPLQQYQLLDAQHARRTAANNPAVVVVAATTDTLNGARFCVPRSAAAARTGGDWLLPTVGRARSGSDSVILITYADVC